MTKSTKPTLRQQQLRSTGQAILASALNHFSRRGFEGASLRDIAQEAGVQHGMIRHIYQTKSELWRQAIVFLFDRMEGEMPAAIERGSRDDITTFKAFIHWYVGYCARHPEHARIMIQQSILEGPELQWAAERYIREGHDWCRPVIERLQASGALPNVDPMSLFIMLTAASQMPFLLAPEILAVSGRDLSVPDEIERHADSIIRVFLREPAPGK